MQDRPGDRPKALHRKLGNGNVVPRTLILITVAQVVMPDNRGGHEVRAEVTRLAPLVKVATIATLEASNVNDYGVAVRDRITTGTLRAAIVAKWRRVTAWIPVNVSG
jgi:hypothetical protein